MPGTGTATDAVCVLAPTGCDGARPSAAALLGRRRGWHGRRTRRAAGAAAPGQGPPDDHPGPGRHPLGQVASSAETIAAGQAGPVTDVVHGMRGRRRNTGAASPRTGAAAGGWSTVEAGTDLADALRGADGTVLVDSLGTWVSASRRPRGRRRRVSSPLLEPRTATTVVVSEEVGLGVHPPSVAGGGSSTCSATSTRPSPRSPTRCCSSSPAGRCRLDALMRARSRSSPSLGGAATRRPRAAVVPGRRRVVGAVVGAVWWAAGELARRRRRGRVRGRRRPRPDRAAPRRRPGRQRPTACCPDAERERRLAIMRPPDVGAFGVAVVALVLLARRRVLPRRRRRSRSSPALWCAARTVVAVAPACAVRPGRGPGLDVPRGRRRLVGLPSRCRRGRVGVAAVGERAPVAVAAASSWRRRRAAGAGAGSAASPATCSAPRSSSARRSGLLVAAARW